MRCAEMAQMLPAYAGGEHLPASARRHLARCSECAAELGRYRLMLGSLATLGAKSAQPPVELKAMLVAIPGTARRRTDVRSHVSAHRRAYGGIAVAVAGAAGALVWATRHRLTPATA